MMFVDTAQQDSSARKQCRRAVNRSLGVSRSACETTSCRRSSFVPPTLYVSMGSAVEICGPGNYNSATHVINRHKQAAENWRRN